MFELKGCFRPRSRESVAFSDKVAEDVQGKSEQWSSTKALAGGYRLTYGGVGVELRQRERMAWKFSASSRPLAQLRRVAYMRASMRVSSVISKAAAEVGHPDFRGALVRKAYRWATGARRTADNAQSSSATQWATEPYHPIGHLLVTLDETERSLAWELFDRGELALDVISARMPTAGAAFAFVSRLTGAELATIEARSLRATASGRAVAAKINSATGLSPLPCEHASR